MRAILSISIALGVIASSACGKQGDPKEEARKEAEALEQKAGAVKPAPKQPPPVPIDQRVPCERLLDPAAFQVALEEKEPLTVNDITKSDPDSAASCSLIKGGKKLTVKEQERLAKKTNHKLGVIPGDEICNVTAYCWTIETTETFQSWCEKRGYRAGEEMGQFTCVQVVAQGADDVFVYRWLDDDTKCVLQVRGGPSNVDNDRILQCAKTARDAIGPAQIKVD